MRAKELPSVKCPRYANIPRFETFPVRPDGGVGSSLMPIQKPMFNSWPRGVGFSHATPPTSFPRPNFARNMWCPRCNRNHTGNCLVGKQCFACGKLGQMQRDYLTLHGHPGASRGTSRQTPGISATSAFWRPANTNRTAVTQASVQQPRAQGRMNTLIQQEARVSNAVVRGTICLDGNIAQVLFDPGALHSFISSSFATKINK